MATEIDPLAVVAARIKAGCVGRATDVWSLLEKRLDISKYRPLLAPDIELRRFELRGGGYYLMAANPRDLVYYRLEPFEAELLPLMDGTRTVAEILVERLRRSGDLEFGQVVDLVVVLRVGNFLADPYVDVHAALTKAVSRPKSAWRRAAHGFVSTLSIEWQGADRMVRWLYHRILRFLFLPLGRALGALVAVAGFVAFVTAVSSQRFELAPQTVGLAFLVLVALDVLIVFIHELGHASVLVAYGRRVKSAGFRLYFGTPAFFIESSDALMLDRRQRMAQAFGGPYFELIAGGAASLALWAWPESALAPTIYRFTVLNYFVLFLNLVPLLELDGYWILSDALQTPDLRPRSLAFVRRDLWHKLLRRQRWSPAEVGLALYGILGVAFTIFCLITAFFFWRGTFGGLGSKMWRSGPLGVVLMLVLALFVAGPALRGFAALFRLVWRRVMFLFRQITFRAQRRWRVEAAQLLDAQPLFDDLPVDVLNDVAGRVNLRRVSSGTAVVRQGERADAYYVVRKGPFEVVEEDRATSTQRVLRRLGPGDGFGEMGLAAGAPRNATVRAASDGELFVLDKGTFDRLLADRVRLPSIEPTLQMLAELRALPSFAHLSPAELADLASRGTWENRPPGDCVIEEGQVGDAFYVVASGRLQVVQSGRVARHLSEGDHFGEIALLLNTPRTATVCTETPVRLFRLNREAFNDLIEGAFRRGALLPNVALDRLWDH